MSDRYPDHSTRAVGHVFDDDACRSVLIQISDNVSLCAVICEMPEVWINEGVLSGRQQLEPRSSGGKHQEARRDRSLFCLKLLGLTGFIFTPAFHNETQQCTVTLLFDC